MDSFGYKYLVAIRCMTFLHANYITDALNGFCMQQTEFPYVCMVVDDASTDGEQNVIREYIAEHFVVTETRAIADGLGEYVIAKHKINANCDLVYVELSQNLYRERERKLSLIRSWQEMAKYEALCEGDDYWTDPHKLQKQVDFLEEHQNYSFTFHKAVVLQKGEIDSSLYAHLENRDYSAAEIYDVWSVPTASVVYRRTMCGTKRPKHVVFGDILLFLNLLDNGLAYCMDFTGSVYRRHSGGISYSISYNLAKELFYQYREMESLFPNVRKISQRKKCEYLEYLIWDNAKSDVWKFRFYYMWLHKHLFLSSFFTTTILSYMLKPLCKSICNR